MSTRLPMMIAADQPGVSITELCAQLGISRNTFYRLRRRYRTEGVAGLAAQSRRPHTSPGQTTGWLEARIVGLREQLPADRGAQTIYWELQRLGIDPPSVRTIHRILARNGMVTPQPQKRPRSSYRRFEYDKPNGCWQIDASGWQLASGRTAWIMDVLDDHSRVMTAAHAVAGPTLPAALTTWHHATRDWGTPAKTLSDNGSCFTGSFETTLHALGVTVSHSRPHHPQTCGKIERVHQTLKRWLTPLPRAGGLDELQHQLDTFRDYYNHHRPHRALHGATPAQRFAATTPDQPARQPIPTTDLTTTSHKVGAKGGLQVAGNLIGIPRRYYGQRLTAIHYGNMIIVCDEATLIRKITLEPGRRNYGVLSHMS